MDFDEKQKRQTIKVIIAEICMVLAIVVVVVISTLAAMGFMISGNGSIEQSGLLQLHTMPTGASVDVDGVTVFGRTNLSRTLSAGEHKLEVYRDGYDRWSKTIKMRSGVLMRLYYPRLFLNQRVAETAMKLNENDALEFYIPSLKRNFILYAEKAAAEWQLLDIRGDELKKTTLDVGEILPGMVEKKIDKKVTLATVPKYTFAGKVEEVVWSKNEESVLVKTNYEGKTEWTLIRLRDLARSVNLTKTFGLSNEAQFAMIDEAANQLYVLEKHQLRRINVVDKVMSRILASDVLEFMNDETKVIYVAGDSERKNREIRVFRDDEKNSTVLMKVPDEVNVKVALSNYFDEDYMIWTLNEKVYIIYGRLPSYDENRENLDGLKSLVEETELAEIPESLTVSPGGEYIMAQRGNKYMVTDLDHGDLYEYDAPNNVVRWFDDSMLYAVDNRQIVVWDFDGTNQRNLSENVKTKNETPVAVDANSLVTVTANNKFIYYLTSEDKITYLTREKIKD